MRDPIDGNALLVRRRQCSGFFRTSVLPLAAALWFIEVEKRVNVFQQSRLCFRARVQQELTHGVQTLFFSLSVHTLLYDRAAHCGELTLLSRGIVLVLCNKISSGRRFVGYMYRTRVCLKCTARQKTAASKLDFLSSVLGMVSSSRTRGAASGLAVSKAVMG